jgi:hypothetical protein
VKISRDTRESLIFVVGVLGLVSQGVVGAAGRPVSIPLCLIYMTICGVIGVPALLGAIIPAKQPPEERRRADDRAPND